jgi:hypothetical protein
VNALGVEKAYRYDRNSSDCANPVDCSIYYKNPNIKTISQAFSRVRPKNGVHPKGMNQLQLGFAALFNHDCFRSAFNSTFLGIPRMVWPWTPIDTEPNTASMTSNPTYISRGAVLGAACCSNNSVFEVNFVQSGDNSVLATGNYVPGLQYVMNRVNGAPGTGPGTGKPKDSQAGTTPTWDLDLLYGGSGTNWLVPWDNTTGKIRIDPKTGFLPSTLTGALIIVPGAWGITHLLVSEHNWYVDQLNSHNITLNATAKFMLAKRWTIATWQALTWYEYIPATFGFDIFGPLPLFDASTHPKVNTNPDWTPIPVEVQAISHYAYSAFPTQYHWLDENWNIIHQDSFLSAMSTRAVSPVYPLLTMFGIDALIRGSVNYPQEPIDLWFNELSRSSTQFTGDMMARMLGRGRDIGLPTFNDVRRAWGLNPISSFSDFTNLSDEYRTALATVYNNDTELIDLWIGGLAEYDPLLHMSETWTVVYRQAMTDVRDYDRYWFEGAAAGFTAGEIDQLRNTKLSTLILKHTKITKIQCAALFTGPKDCPSGPEVAADTCPTPNSVSLVGSAFKVSWHNATAGSNKVTFTLKAHTTGFVALGFPSTAGKMLGATAFIGTVKSGKAEVGIYHIDARQPCTRGAGVCPTNNTVYTVSEVSGTEVNGTTTITFSVSPVPTSPALQNIIGSFGSSDSIAYHGPNKGVAQIQINVDPVVPTTTPPTAAPSLDIFDSSIFDYHQYLDLNPSATVGLDTEAKARQHFLTFGLPSLLPGSVEFDAGVYLNTYPDVAASYGDGFKAVHHYLNYGKKEGRVGSVFGLSTSALLSHEAVFNSAFYLANNPDLPANGITTVSSALRHWLTFGAKEGRVASSTFNVRTYLATYADLSNAFGTNYVSAIVHYVSFGKAEGRKGN